MRVVKQLLVLCPGYLHNPACSWASLGDNYEKLEDSYGSIGERRLRDDGTVSILYHKDRYLYLVIFGDGHSISEPISTRTAPIFLKKRSPDFLKPTALAPSRHRPMRERNGTSDATMQSRGNIRNRTRQTRADRARTSLETLAVGVDC